MIVKEPHHLFTRLLETILLAPPPKRPRGKCVFVACFPKSGSTYLTKTLERITGFRHAFFANHGRPATFEISEIKVGQNRNLKTVVQQHTKGTAQNIRILKSYGIKPVVLVRNIFDVVPSILDHIAKVRIGAPMGYVHEQYFEMTEEEKLTYIARIHIPRIFGRFITR